jgi:hypothetical protein
MAAAAIFYDKRTLVSASATTAAAGYPASNLGSESLARPYRATGLGATDIQINYAAATPLHSFSVHDVNFASCTFQKSSDGAAFTTVGTLTTYADRDGRRRGRILVNDATVKAVKLQIGAGSATDGLAFWRAGAGYGWISTQTVPADLIFPVNEDIVPPAIAQDLPNGLVAEAGVGTRFSRIDTSWNRESTESLATLIGKARVATIWFDAGTSDYLEQQWPVYLQARDRLRESFDRFRYSRPTITLTERV